MTHDNGAYVTLRDVALGRADDAVERAGHTHAEMLTVVPVAVDEAIRVTLEHVLARMETRGNLHDLLVLRHEIRLAIEAINARYR